MFSKLLPGPQLVRPTVGLYALLAAEAGGPIESVDLPPPVATGLNSIGISRGFADLELEVNNNCPYSFCYTKSSIEHERL